MQFLTSLFGGSENIWLTAAFALGAVIVLILLLSWVLRLFSGTGGARPGRGRQRRLAVVDSLAVDPKRTLLIVRRDNVEHLILTGGPGDVVVERGIPVEPDSSRQPNRRQPPPSRPVEPPAPPAAPNVTAFDRRQAPRHPGLLRPVSAPEPSLSPQPIPAPAPISSASAGDSAMYEADTSSEGRHPSADTSARGRTDQRTD